MIVATTLAVSAQQGDKRDVRYGVIVFEVCGKLGFFTG